MSPKEKIKLTVLKHLELDSEEEFPEETDEYYESLREFRDGQYETDIPAPSSRHYESRSVASRMYDGTYVGWTYWYGGGKHGCPGEIDWIEDAYELEMTEEEKLVTVRTWSKK